MRIFKLLLSNNNLKDSEEKRPIYFPFPFILNFIFYQNIIFNNKEYFESWIIDLILKNNKI